MGKITTRQLIDQLREALDLPGTQAALERGDITERQAKGIRTWIEAVRTIRANPLVLVYDHTGGLIGDVLYSEERATWSARLYGPTYHQPDHPAFPTQEEAEKFLCNTPKQQPI